jgi:3'(2'), 5'-bisphosphate nucleotidase
MPIIDQEVTDKLMDIMLDSGRAIMEVYNSDNDQISLKEDDVGRTSPVTIADTKSHTIIVEGLTKIDRSIPIVSEEQSESDNLKASLSELFWIIDPLDGTKSFIQRGRDFTVNIGLIKNKKPVFGMIYVPVTETFYWGDVEDGAWKKKADELPEKIEVSKNKNVKTAVASKSHFDPVTEKFLSQFVDIDLQQAGSSLKLCLVAEGKADIYPRFAPTMEWDTAAADAVLRAAGGFTSDLSGVNDLGYCKPHFRNPGFVCTNSIVKFEI